MNYLVISSSLNQTSRSRILAQKAFDLLQERTGTSAKVEFLDLNDLPLPMCDGAGCYDDQNAVLLKQRVAAAHGILMALPIYNYDVNAAAKNVIELTGREGWNGKIAGFLCAAGGEGSYMSIMSLAASLMLDFRTVVIPQFIYALYNDFDEDQIANQEVVDRIDGLTKELVRFTTALSSLD